MAEEKIWHPNFIKYMEMIANHPNYRGLPIARGRDGSLGWIAAAKSPIGASRIRWCKAKAKELGIPDEPGVYAKVMLELHPTKKKVCQICGQEMSLYYHYPSVNLLKKINGYYRSNFTECDHISDIWDSLAKDGKNTLPLARILIEAGDLNLSSNAPKETIIDSLEKACRLKSKKALSPGAMSNFPDRFDGFHSYNRCCRSSQDKGRSKENLKSYTKDRRAYEYWSDGNIHAANQFMGSPFFKGASADHIGPISLGFIHDPRYLQKMSSSDNSSKRDRLQLDDVEKIIRTQEKTGIYPMSWQSKLIWEHIRANYRNNIPKISGVYRDALKQNMINFMHILHVIMDKSGSLGKVFLEKAFLEPNFDYFKYSYTFSSDGTIISRTPRHYTGRNDEETDRYVRIAFEAVTEFEDKDNRRNSVDLTVNERIALQQICQDVRMGKAVCDCKREVEVLVESVEKRLIRSL